MRKLEILAILSETIRFPKEILSVLSNTTSHQTFPFYETHNLLSTQIKISLFINPCKSLRSKITFSHWFKILRAVWHKTAIFHKDFLIAQGLRPNQKIHRSEF